MRLCCQVSRVWRDRKPVLQRRKPHWYCCVYAAAKAAAYKSSVRAMTPLRIFMVDDSIVVRKIVCDTLAEDPALAIVGSASDARAALATNSKELTQSPQREPTGTPKAQRSPKRLVSNNAGRPKL
jgi:hypothetical protein